MSYSKLFGNVEEGKLKIKVIFSKKIHRYRFRDLFSLKLLIRHCKIHVQSVDYPNLLNYSKIYIDFTIFQLSKYYLSSSSIIWRAIALNRSKKRPFNLMKWHYICRHFYSITTLPRKALYYSVTKIKILTLCTHNIYFMAINLHN